MILIRVAFANLVAVLGVSISIAALLYNSGAASYEAWVDVLVREYIAAMTAIGSWLNLLPIDGWNLGRTEALRMSAFLFVTVSALTINPHKLSIGLRYHVYVVLLFLTVVVYTGFADFADAEPAGWQVLAYILIMAAVIIIMPALTRQMKFVDSARIASTVYLNLIGAFFYLRF